MPQKDVHDHPSGGCMTGGSQDGTSLSRLCNAEINGQWSTLTVGGTLRLINTTHDYYCMNETEQQEVFNF